ncbi:methylosome protein WDR77-like [Achroia grisella]|uniref:methylosome protein WDR77-like n=1 Tax=Achroia grisella TaxID=688607 RepID=UPI0027D2F950|nr:methylosome protein WDR77-like [Achroia grisella]
MENSNKIVPPHLNAEVYRTDTTGTTTVSYLDYILIQKDSSVLIGCSELTGRYWNGGASVYTDIQDALKCHNGTKSSIYLTSGTADGCFIGNSSKVLLCEDSGAVSIWSTTCDAWKLWNEDISAAEHDDAALAVGCLVPEKEYITVGGDGNVKIWDINEMICMTNYNAAHSRAIYSVSVKSNSNTIFATGSLDEFITLWDQNVSKPVLDLVQNNCGIRCLQWIDENRLVFGDEAGVLSLVDARNPQEVTKLTEFPAAVHKLVAHRESHKMGVCCDNNIVSVCSVSEDCIANVVYHDRHMHKNYVRGMAWDIKEDNVLHTLGWDGTIQTHNIVWE